MGRLLNYLSTALENRKCFHRCNGEAFRSSQSEPVLRFCHPDTRFSLSVQSLINASKMYCKALTVSSFPNVPLSGNIHIYFQGIFKSIFKVSLTVNLGSAL